MDSSTLTLMAASDAVLEAQELLGAALAKGRAELAFSRLQSAAFSGASLTYAPRHFQPITRVRVRADEAAVRGFAASAGAGVGAAAPAAKSSKQAAGKAGSAGGASATVTSDPLSWYGSNASPCIGTAQTWFLEAVRQAAVLAAERRKLSHAVLPALERGSSSNKAKR